MSDIAERLKQGPVMVGSEFDYYGKQVSESATECIMHAGAVEIELLRDRCKSLETALIAIRDDESLDAELCRNVASMALRGE